MIPQNLTRFWSVKGIRESLWSWFPSNSIILDPRISHNTSSGQRTVIPGSLCWGWVIIFLHDCVISSFTHFLQLSMDSKETVRKSNVILSPFRSFSQFSNSQANQYEPRLWRQHRSWGRLGKVFRKKNRTFRFFVQISWADFRGKQQQTTFGWSTVFLK